MFLKFLKNFLLKRTLKKSLLNVKNNFSADAIKTVGILVDETYFNETESLVTDLVQSGISKGNITVLVYKDKIRKNEIVDHPAFSLKNISWSGNIESQEVALFSSQHFDMLINYYDIEKAALLLVTQNSKASFKVGFATIDKRLNHFMINTIAENHAVFIDELFRYLKILNKI